MTSAIDKLFGGGDSKPAPTPEPKKADGPANPKIEARATDFETREQVANQRAANAGATRSDNDADVLGYALPRKRSAGRAILG